MKKFVALGEKRKELDLTSAAEIAAVYDAKSLFVTKHWKAEEPYRKGADCMDYFSQWFCDSQARSLHRLGAPVDFLYRFDLLRKDADKFRLYLMMNTFYLTSREIEVLKSLFRNSGATVVWFYAPGFVSPEKLDVEQMENLTGFSFKIHTEPGPMQIKTKIEDEDGCIEMEFGTKPARFPRFSVIDEDVEPLGFWSGTNDVAFAMKKMQGWTSIYVGTAPVPVEILRWFVKISGGLLWSTEADIVKATKDAAMIVATGNGKRLLQMPKPMSEIGEKIKSMKHQLVLQKGDVKLYISNQ